jgi:hypothetical protein
MPSSSGWRLKPESARLPAPWRFVVPCFLDGRIRCLTFPVFLLISGLFAAVTHKTLTRQLQQGTTRHAEPAPEADGRELAAGCGFVRRGATKA